MNMIFTLILCLMCATSSFALETAVKIVNGGIQFPVDGSTQYKSATTPVCDDGEVLVANSGSWHCGSIKIVTNGVATCTQGGCAINACVSGFKSCDNNANNGCEVDITTVQNCGACGNICTGQLTCLTGVCTAPPALSLQIDALNAAAGSSLNATVHLTGGLSVAGVSITINTTYQGLIIGSVSAITDITGTANFNIPFEMAPFPRAVSLQAISSGITPSNMADVLVSSPTLITNFFEIKYFPTAYPAIAGNLVMAELAGAATFKDSYDSPVPNRVMRFTLTSQVGQSAPLNVNGNYIAPGNYIDLLTDSAGMVSINLNAELLSSPDAGGSRTVTFYYTLTTNYGGIVFSQVGDSTFSAISP